MSSMGVATSFVASDLVKVKGTGDRLKVQLVTGTGVPVAGVPITLTVNGVGYDRTTDSNGGASLAINLDYGSYTCSLRFNGDSQYNASTGSVNIRVRDKYVVTISTNNPYSKTYGQPGGVTAVFYEEAGNPAKSLPVQFTINGVSYNRTTDSKGEARLNINLRPGEYDLLTSCLGDDKRQPSDIHTIVRVKSDTHIIGQDMVKMEGELKVYECSVLNVFNERLTNVTVRFTVNGVSYNRLTDGNGVARLNIRLPKGEYDILVEYLGSRWYNPSSRSNHITSKPYMQSLTTTGKDGLTYPGNNIGFMESHIYTMHWDADKSKKGNWKTILLPEGGDYSYAQDIPFTSYEITETDPRVKTAKFTSPLYMDLTRGRHWVIISSPYHENFGGQILKVDYDKNTGLYTYQCQDGRRQYLGKSYMQTSADISVYQILESLLVAPNGGGSNIAPLTDDYRNNPMNKRLLSGLHPIEAYEGMKSGAVKFDNKFKEPGGELLSYDSLMDKIMALSHIGQFPTDVYFTPDGVCHIDPVDLDVWLKSGFKLTHSDLVQYKYGFDTTNVVTSVLGKGGTKWYNDNSDIQWYFGAFWEVIESTTTQTTTTTSTSTSSTGTGAHKGKPIVVGCDNNNSNDSALQNTVVNKLRNAGYTVEKLSIGPNYFANYDWHGAAKGKIGVYIMASSVISIGDAMSSFGHGFDYLVFCNRDNELGRNSVRNWDTAKWRPDNDCNSACNGWSGLTSAQIVEKMGNRGTMVAGNTNEEMANNVLAAVNGDKVNPPNSSSSNTSNTNNTTTTTTVVDEVATYQKALDEMSKSVRNLLSFEIRLPLNDPMFKNLHTNQMLWTELPREFQLTNLSKIFKIAPTYKVNRGVQYMENRWYIEKNVIKCDKNGLFSTLTLNPFPSSYSSYANAVKGYLEAYNQAFKQQQAQTTNTTSATGAGQARLGRDSTDTNSMRCMSGGGYGNAGTGKNFDSCSQKGYAQEGRKYYDWARQFNDPLSLAKALAKRFDYKKYSGNQDANAEVTHNNGGTIHCNCYDACRLVKCCFDAAGLDAVIITGYIYGWGHGWNAVKYNGKWYSFDLCFEYTAGTDQDGSNALRKFF